MDQTMFADLMQAAQEMVAIENGEREPAVVRAYDVPDTKCLREQFKMQQTEFAAAIGVSTSLVQSWEQGRRFPNGASLKILRLLEREPNLIKQLQSV